MKLGFTGTRLGMTREQRDRCWGAVRDLHPEELHHGDACGADAEMHQLARELVIRVVVHPPINDSQRAYCNGDELRDALPYMARNRSIVDETDLLLAIPHGPAADAPRSGTWRTIRYAERRGKPVLIIHPDGSQSQSLGIP